MMAHAAILIELPGAKSQVEKRSYRLYQVTFHGIGHDEGTMNWKRKGGLCAHVASNRNEGNARDL
jgi:hypothetical protein